MEHHDNLPNQPSTEHVLTYLLGISKALIEERREEEILKICVEGVQQIGFDRVRLYTLSEDKQHYESRAQVGMHKSLQDFKLSVKGDPLLENIHHSDELQLMVREGNKPLRYDEELDRADVKEWIYLPLSYRNQPIGLLVADNKNSQKPIKLNEWKATLPIFASLAAAAIHDARLVAQEQAAQRKAELHAMQLEAVRRIVLALNSTKDKDQLLLEIVRHTIDLLQARSGGIKTYDPYSGRLRVIVSSGHPDDITGHEMEADEGMAGFLIRSSENVINIPDYRMWPGRILEFARKGWLESVLAVKLKWQQHVIGVLYVEDEVSHRFTLEDEELLQLLADHVSVALINLENESRITQLVSSAPIGVIANTRRSITDFNGQATKILGYTQEEAIGLNVTKIFADEDEPRRVAEVIAQSGCYLRQRTTLRHKLGTEISVRLSVVPIAAIGGKDLTYVGYFEDLSQIEETRDQIDLLLSATKTIIEAKSPEDGLQKLAQKLVPALRTSFCRIFLLDERVRSLAMEAVYPLAQTNDGIPWRPRIGQRTAIAEWEGLESVLFKDFPCHLLKVTEPRHRPILERWSDMLGLDQVIQSLLVVPIRTGDGKVVGLLDIGEMRPENQAPITREKERLVVAIARQTAGLIEQSLMKKLLLASFESSQKLVSATNPEIALVEIADKILQIANAHGIRILLFDSGGQPQDLIERGDEDLRVGKFNRQKGLSEKILESGECLYIGNTQKTKYDINASWKVRGVRAAIGLPFSREGKRIGVVWIYYKQPQYFTDSEIKAYELCVNQAAKAYDNVHAIKLLRQVWETAGKIAQIATLTDEAIAKKTVVESVQQVMQSDVITLHIYARESDTWLFPVTARGNSRPIPPLTTNGSVPLVLQRFKEHEDQMWLVEDVNQEPVFRQSRFTREEQIASCAAVKLLMQGELIGALFVSYRRPHSFSAEEQAALTLFANQAAIAIHNAQLYERERKQALTFLALSKTLQAAEPNNVLDEFLFTIAEQAVKLTGEYGLEARHCYMALVSNRQIQFQATFPREHLPDLQRHVGIIKLDEPGQRIGITGLAVTQKEPILEGNVKSSEYYIEYLPETRSALAVPIISGNDVIGVIDVEHPEPNAFDNNDITNLVTLAQHTAVGIQNLELYAREQSQRKLLDAMHRSAQAITRSLERDMILNRLAEQAKILLSQPGRDVNYTSIWLVVDERTAQPLAAWPPDELDQTLAVTGDNFNYVEGSGGKIGIIGRAIQTKKPVNAPNVHKHDDYLPSHPETNSELAVPFMDADERIIGVINVESEVYDAFNEHDEDVLLKLAQYASIAVQNHWHYDEVRKMQAYIGPYKAVEFMQMVSEMHRHAIIGKTSPIRTVIGSLRNIINETSRSQRADTLLTQMEKLLDEVNNVITPLSPIEDISINYLIKDYMESRWRRDRWLEPDYPPIQLNISELRLHLDDAHTVKASYVIIRYVLEWLVDNAKHAMRHSLEKKLTVSTSLKPRSSGNLYPFLEIRITDTGPGFPEQILKEQGKIWHGNKASGIGLPLTHSLIQTFEGKMKLRNPSSGGAEVVIQLPAHRKGENQHA